MQNEIIKSKLAYSSNSYKTAASEERYVDHVVVSKSGKLYVVAIIDCLSGSRKAYAPILGGLCSFRDSVPIYNKYRYRQIRTYEVVREELVTIGGYSPIRHIPSEASHKDYTEIEVENYYEKIVSAEPNEDDTFDVVIKCKDGGMKKFLLKKSKQV